MVADYTYALKKLHSLTEIHVPYAIATNMPFVTCDQETFNDQIWIFTSMDEVRAFAARYEQEKILFKGVSITKESFQLFYMDLHAMGINEVVFFDGTTEHKLPLNKIVNLPNFAELPLNKRPLLNPELQLSTIYFFQEVRRQGVEQDTDRLEILAEEMYANLAKATFLMPILKTPRTDIDIKGCGSISLPYITDAKGNKFQPIFSDHTQYMKHIKKNKPVENTSVLMVKISDLLKYTVPDSQGYMLNPDGYCHVVNQQQLQFIIERFATE